MSDLLHNIWHGCRMAILRPVKLSNFRVSYYQIGLLVISTLLLIIAKDYLLAGTGAEFNRYGITHNAWYFSLCFLGFFLIALVFEVSKARQFITVAFSGLLTFSIVSVFYNVLMTRIESDFYVVGWLAWLVLLLWFITILFRAITLVFAEQAPSRQHIATASISFTVLLFALLLSVPEQRLFWPEQSGTGYEYQQLDVEKIYYQQPALLNASTTALLPQQTQQTDLYLLTFASYGLQDVFKKEIEFVQQAVEQRFNNTGRSVSLLNHADTVNDVPLANHPNLVTAMQGLQQKMDTEQDILMVYLTSHGSRDAKLSADLWPLQPNAIDADQLKMALDETGIKWRIIIVSACYSGSFIEPLQDENSLIITASAADKTSFGCSHDRDLTYFAEAFFQHAWPQTHSLLETFELANIWVTDKERSENKINSEPQLFIGQAMQEHLKSLEAALDGQAQ